MIRLKFLSSICIGTFVYVLISFLGGHNGIWAMKQLEIQKNTLSNNVAKIEKINDNLTVEFDGLTKNKDVIAGYAKKLGFVSENEKLIKINGLGRQYNQIYETGSVIEFAEIDFIPEWICKIFGLVVFCLSMLVFLLLSFCSNKNSLKNTIDHVQKKEQTLQEYEVIQV